MMRIELTGGTAEAFSGEATRHNHVAHETVFECPATFEEWSGREDSNLRPPGPEPGALPDCATPRINA